jgi:hypothetical protein
VRPLAIFEVETDVAVSIAKTLIYFEANVPNRVVILPFESFTVRALRRRAVAACVDGFLGVIGHLGADRILRNRETGAEQTRLAPVPESCSYGQGTQGLESDVPVRHSGRR